MRALPPSYRILIIKCLVAVLKKNKKQKKKQVLRLKFRSSSQILSRSKTEPLFFELKGHILIKDSNLRVCLTSLYQIQTQLRLFGSLKQKQFREACCVLFREESQTQRHSVCLLASVSQALLDPCCHSNRAPAPQ